MASPRPETPTHRGRTGGRNRHEQARDISRLLYAVAHMSTRRFEDAATELGLAPPQARALLGLEEPVPMSALASNMACDASNITAIADRLETRGLVERQVDEADRRVKRLVLTPAGRQLRSELLTRVTETAPAMAELDAGERQTLLALLEKLAGPDACAECG